MDPFGHLMQAVWHSESARLAAIYGSMAESTMPFLASAAAEMPLLFWIPPVLAFEGVMMALGSGYAASRKLVGETNAQSGFSQGLVCGVLDWNISQTLRIIGRHSVVRINTMDHATDSIRVGAFNSGLRFGYTSGSAYTAEMKKGMRIALRRAAGIHGGGAWSKDADDARLQQVEYVIRLASAGQRTKLIRMQR